MRAAPLHNVSRGTVNLKVYALRCAKPIQEYRSREHDHVADCWRQLGRGHQGNLSLHVAL
jgi:hypothetical protein